MKSLYFKKNIYLFGWLVGWLVGWLRRVLAAARGISFPDQGLNPGPLHWEREVLATGPPGKSEISLFLNGGSKNVFKPCAK